jgi:hypothetical protein
VHARASRPGSRGFLLGMSCLQLRLLVAVGVAVAASPWFDVLPAAAPRSVVPPLSLHTVPQTLADAHGAKCLDGSPPAMYVLLQDPLKWVIFVEGGGWCFSVASCAGRSEGGGGSSRGMRPTMDVGGLLSPSPATNPRFFNWTFVFLHYCDGSSHVRCHDDFPIMCTLLTPPSLPARQATPRCQPSLKTKRFGTAGAPTWPPILTTSARWGWGRRRTWCTRAAARVGMFHARAPIPDRARKTRHE